MKIYTKNGCPYCTKAKEALTNIGVKYEEILVTNTEEFKVQHNWPTFPLIYDSLGHRIGGYNELVKWIFENGLI